MNEKIALKAEAATLGIDGYRTMGLDELRVAIEDAKVTKPLKGKATNGASPARKPPVKGKVSRTPAKGKGKTAPAAKSKGRKTVARKRTAVRGKASRVDSPARRIRATTGRKTVGRKTVARKARGVKSTAVAEASTRKRGQSYRAGIDRTVIDWSLESNVGATPGKRQDVMKALRKHKGNYDKVFDALVDNARTYYKGKTKHDAELMLRWLINRVAYDYVLKSGQHKPGKRAAYGSATDSINVKRREQRAAAAKAAGGRRTAATGTRARKAVATPRKRSAAKRAPVKRAAVARKGRR